MNDLSQTQPLVSIIMPVYNGRRLIDASLKSILNQTYDNWECIIVDDGSTDGTSVYVDEIHSIDTRFKIIHHNHNMGRASARQTALNACLGKYITMLDAEDLWHPDKLRIQVSLMESDSNISLASASMISFGSHTNILRRRGYIFDEIKTYDGSNTPIHASSILRTNRAKQFKFNTTWKLGEDVNFLQQYLTGTKFAQQKDNLYYYSEFDSVTKRKILDGYIRLFKESVSCKKIKPVCVIALKLLTVIITYPFISIETIIKARGNKLSEDDLKYFETNLRPLIREYSSFVVGNK